MAAPWSEAPALTKCRAMVAGFGLPGLRDLDFGRHFVTCVEGLGWPEDVVVEDLSCGATLVLQRLQELRPAKLLLIGAVTRALDPPGTIRRYVPREPAEGAEDVHEHLVAALSGMVDLDHTISVVRHWGALPADTVVIEVEPADTSPGLGFSEELAAAIDPILDMVRDELGTACVPSLGAGGAEAGEADTAMLWDRIVGDPPDPPEPAAAEVNEPTPAERPSEALLEFVDYARGYESIAALLDGSRPAFAFDGDGRPQGLSVAARSRPWGTGPRIGGDWYDVVPLESGRVAVLIGDVPGRGAEVAAVMSQLRTAALAYALLDGDHPARVIGHLDRLVQAAGVGEMTTVLCLALDRATGTARLARAGHCPPLVLSTNGTAELFEEGLSVPLGALDGVARTEATLSLPGGSTLLLYTDGLVEGRQLEIGDGLAKLRRAVANGPAGLEALCEHVFGVCTEGRSQDDDVSLLAVRRVG